MLAIVKKAIDESITKNCMAQITLSELQQAGLLASIVCTDLASRCTSHKTLTRLEDPWYWEEEYWGKEGKSDWHVRVQC